MLWAFNTERKKARDTADTDGGGSDDLRFSTGLVTVLSRRDVPCCRLNLLTTLRFFRLWMDRDNLASWIDDYADTRTHRHTRETTHLCPPTIQLCPCWGPEGVGRTHFKSLCWYFKLQVAPPWHELRGLRDLDNRDKAKREGGGYDSENGTPLKSTESRNTNSSVSHGTIQIEN